MKGACHQPATREAARRARVGIMNTQAEPLAENKRRSLSTINIANQRCALVAHIFNDSHAVTGVALSFADEARVVRCQV